MVQQRPYFIRPQDSDSIAESSVPASAFIDRCSSNNNSSDGSNSNNSRFGLFGCSRDITPLSQPNSVVQSDLVRSSESSSSRFSRLFFCWPGEIMAKGAKRQLEFHDLYRLNDDNMPDSAWRRFRKHRKPGRPLLAALLIALAPEFLTQSLFAIAESVLYFSGPFFLQRILRFIETYKDGSSPEKPVGLRVVYLDALGLFVFTVLTSLLAHRCLWVGSRISILIKGLLVSELSLKTLQRSSTGAWDRSDASDSQEEDSDGDEDGDEDKDDGDSLSASNGKIMNLLTADFERITEVSAHLDGLYALPIMLLMGIWYMYVLLGISAIVGLLMAILYVPISKTLLQYLSKIERELNLLSDKRIAAITELLQGIKTVKLFGWETGFLHCVNEHRESQLAFMWKNLMAWARMAIASSLAPMFILVVIFGVYAIGLGQQLTAEVAFTAISVFQLIRIVFEQLPGTLNWIVGGYVSLQRIDQYLQQPQLQSSDVRIAKHTDSQNEELGFANANLEWAGQPEIGAKALSVPTASSASAFSANSEQMPLLADIVPSGTRTRLEPDLESALQSQSSPPCSANGTNAPFALKSIDIRFPLGSLSLIAGPTGSGKSSLLAALIGEMTLTRGHILLP
ncbi:hypothetical protein J3B02_004525, partial [Coemansia erecta]